MDRRVKSADFRRRYCMGETNAFGERDAKHVVRYDYDEEEDSHDIHRTVRYAATRLVGSGDVGRIVRPGSAQGKPPQMTPEQTINFVQSTVNQQRASSARKAPIPTGKQPRITFSAGHRETKSQPESVFFQLRNSKSQIADVLLYCLGFPWELHSAVIRKSILLQRAYEESVDSDQNDVKARGMRAVEKENMRRLYYGSRNSNGTTSDKYMDGNVLEGMVFVNMKLQDRSISKRGLALALASLYAEGGIPPIEDSAVLDTLKAARELRLEDLSRECVRRLPTILKADNLVDIYDVLSQERSDETLTCVTRWLEVNLVPVLSQHSSLGKVPITLMEKLLQSERLFYPDEISLFRTLLYWTYHQLNPGAHVPSYPTLQAFVRSRSSTTTLLDTIGNPKVTQLFQLISFSGIAEAGDLAEVYSMKVVPPEWIINVMSGHLYAYQHGGHMVSLQELKRCAIRRGFVLDRSNSSFKGYLSLYGYHFTLHGECDGNNSPSFFIERLSPTHHDMDFSRSHNALFSISGDRMVRYKLLVQSLIQGEYRSFDTGTVQKRFGLQQSNRSSVHVAQDLVLPVFVSFFIYFPSG